MAEILNISKPAITRAVDRLSYFGLAKRKRDATDRRSVLLQRTVKGSVYLSEFADVVMLAAAQLNRKSSAGLPSFSSPAVKA
jgi:DNA-binding MarR family transcriptional regulator